QRVLEGRQGSARSRQAQLPPRRRGRGGGGRAGGRRPLPGPARPRRQHRPGVGAAGRRAAFGEVLAVRALLLALALALGCSVTKFDHQSCTSNAECRGAYGFGTVCNGDGLCEGAKPIARCTQTFPDDLFTRPARYKDAIVIGSLMDRSSPAHVVREKAIALVVKEAAEEKGNDGKPVAAVFCDIAQKSEYDTLMRSAAAVTSANFLAGTLGVAAIVGPSASADTQQVWEAMRVKGTVVISPAATSPSLLALEPSSTDSA